MAAKLEDAVQKQFDQGVAWLRDHLLNHAEVMLRRALAAAPGHPSIQHYLGIALVKLGRNADGIAMLWEHLSAALTGLHELGFAHGDVKPANVCVDGNGNFFLIDLDSAARFGSATQTTTEYLPIDERGVRVLASARADWWALAMTFAEKACGAASLPLGRGARVWTASEVRAHLEAYLPSGVWMALAGHIA